MHFLTTAVLAGLAASLASAQTFTDCDPTKKTCPNNPAIGTPFTSDFKTGRAALEGWKITANDVAFTSAGADFTIHKRGEAPTIQTNGFFHFGYAEVKMKASGGQGIISSIVLESDDLDEVDWEFIGTTTTNVQTNYFGKGNTTTYDRMIPYDVTTPQETFHTFALNWTAESLTWLIDNVPQRTLLYADAVGGKNYPQTPMNLRIGIWAGGDPDNSPGTISWAGGKTDYTKVPFTMTVDSVKILNYSPGKEYHWADKSGSFESIEVIGSGDTSGGAETAIPSPSPSVIASGSGKGGLASQVDTPSTSISTIVAKPTVTGMVSHSKGCTEGEMSTIAIVSSVDATGIPVQTNPYSGALPVTQISDGQIQLPPAPTASIPAESAASTLSPAESTPCSCGVVTVTLTSGYGSAPITITPTPIESTPSVASVPAITTLAPISSITPIAASPSGALPITQISDGQIQVPPAPSTPVDTTLSPASTEIPLASASLPTYSGLVTETLPAPSVPGISAPSAGFPSTNGTATTTGGIPLFTGAASANAAHGFWAAAAGMVAVLVL